MALAPFSDKLPLSLHRWPNGGWTVSQTNSQGYVENPLGAFGDAAQMLAALNEALAPPHVMAEDEA